MLHRRASAPAVRLVDGRVLLAGGWSGLLPKTGAFAEIYDPATGAFAATGSLATGRSNHAAALLSNGKVLVSGGSPDEYGVDLTDEVFDPTAGTWTTVGWDSARSNPAWATLPDGRVFIMGGSNQQGTLLATVRSFNPAYGAMYPVAPMATARQFHTAVTLQDGRILVAGGSGPSGTSLASAELFNPATGAWSPAASLHIARTCHTATLLPDGRVLVVGGIGGSALTSSEMYDPSTGKWSEWSPMRVARSAHAAVLTAGGKVLVMGGQRSGTVLSSVERYDPATSTWHTIDPLDSARVGFSVAQLADGRFLVAGGEDPPYITGALQTAALYTETCTPVSCQAGYDCGTRDDGCGNLLDCGTCSGNQYCWANTCCAPATCQSLGKNCGSIPDGCGSILNCGTCGSGQVCTPNDMCCTPTTCAAQGATCGVIWNGCGTTLSCGTCGVGQVCSATNTCVAVPGTATYDPVLKAPRCVGTATLCDSGTLLNGRGTIGPEANAPNTINSACSDWNSTIEISSIERLKVSSVDGGDLTTGKQAAIEVTVKPYSYNDSYTYQPVTPDRLDLYYASSVSNPTWTPLASLTPSPVYQQTLTASYRLPPGSIQAIRGVFGYLGTSSGSCTSGLYLDVDDLAFPVTQPPDPAPPATALTAPADGQVVSNYATLTAMASDDVWVTKVEFYEGATLLGSVVVPPYTFSWNTRTVANGSHSLTSKAYDTGGNTTTSAPVTVVVNNDVTPPTAAITSPVTGDTVGGTVSIGVTATDDVQVLRIDFYVDGAFVGATSTVPYAFSWNSATVTNGNHTLSVIARDTSNNPSPAAAATVAVVNDRTPPTVSLVAPVSGATLSGTVTLSATASDDMRVVLVQFYDGSTLIGSSTAAPYTASWNVSSVTSGSHTLTAKAYDPSGNAGTSAAIPVTVSNGTPSVVVASFDSTLKAPACAARGIGCDSGTLLAGRGSMYLGQETNAPNTLSPSCPDGNYGTFHADESLDELKISTFDGTLLAPGKTVRIDATVWAYSGYSSDKLDLYYSTSVTSPAWTFLATITPGQAGVQTLSLTYVLPAGARQAIRGIFRFGGAAASCSNGGYDDHDDLVFVTQ
jgi:hypothetical protein